MTSAIYTTRLSLHARKKLTDLHEETGNMERKIIEQGIDLVYKEIQRQKMQDSFSRLSIDMEMITLANTGINDLYHIDS